MRLERLSLEQTMEGPSSQGEHAEESDRKRMTTKVFSQETLSWQVVECVRWEMLKAENTPN